MNASERFCHAYHQTLHTPEHALGGNNDAWFTQFREQALDSFSAQGLPTAKTENWKYTRLKPIEQVDFNHTTAPATTLPQDQLDAIPHCPNGYQLVFINGRFEESLSRLPPITNAPIQETILCDFHRAIETHSDHLKSTLGKIAHTNHHPFAALNSMFTSNGVFLWVHQNNHIQQPIHCLFISTTMDKPNVCHPRLLLIMEDNSEATVFEHYMFIPEFKGLKGPNTQQATESPPFFTNAVTEILMGPNARMQHYTLQQESPANIHIAGLHVMQQPSSYFSNHSFFLGGKLTRNDIRISLAGKAAECVLTGGYCIGDQQHLDQHIQIDHLEPECHSRTLYKGVIQDHARAVFNGKIVVHPAAQQTNAKLVNKNLLLSTKGHVDTKPELQIYADDVVCSHGATVGQLDDAALFYLQTRGITKTAAKTLLASAFIGETLESISQPLIQKLIIPPVLNQLNQLINPLKKTVFSNHKKEGL